MGERGGGRARRGAIVGNMAGKRGEGKGGGRNVDAVEVAEEAEESAVAAAVRAERAETVA